MGRFNMAFMGKPGKPVSYQPLTEEGPPFEMITVEADDLDGAARAAKAFYQQDLPRQKERMGATGGFFMIMEEHEVGTIMVGNTDAENFCVGSYDYETLRPLGRA